MKSITAFAGMAGVGSFDEPGVRVGVQRALHTELNAPLSGPTVMDYNERSAYPHPEEFKVMRPEYLDLEDGYWQASITITPFKVVGRSVTMPGARRAAIFEASKTYRSYHPSYRVDNPYPAEFTDQDGQQWKALTGLMREKNGDYAFTDADGEEDYADIEQMLAWDVRPADEA